MTRFDRRALFASGAAAALLAATGVSLAGPKRGGHLRIAVPRTQTGLHPIARAAVYETLTELSPEGLLQGRLATGWRSSPESMTWEIDLRRDVTFHDGTSLTAADVAASLEFLGAAEIRLTEDGVLIMLDRPDPQLPIRLASPDHVIGPAAGAVSGPAPGTGLYAVRREIGGGGVVAERVARHHRGEVAGWADRLEIAVFSDPKVRAQAVNEGLVDIALEPDEASLDTGSGLRLLPAGASPVLALRPGVGVPDWRDYPDLQLAERVWLA